MRGLIVLRCGEFSVDDDFHTNMYHYHGRGVWLFGKMQMQIDGGGGSGATDGQGQGQNIKYLHRRQHDIT